MCLKRFAVWLRFKTVQQKGYQLQKTSTHFSRQNSVIWKKLGGTVDIDDKGMCQNRDSTPENCDLGVSFCRMDTQNGVPFDLPLKPTKRGYPQKCRATHQSLFDFPGQSTKKVSKSTHPASLKWTFRPWLTWRWHGTPQICFKSSPFGCCCVSGGMFLLMLPICSCGQGSSRLWLLSTRKILASVHILWKVLAEATKQLASLSHIVSGVRLSWSQRRASRQCLYSSSPYQSSK